MLQAAIFDLDGLLIDSEPLWQQAEIEVFGRLGLELTREQAEETLGIRSDEVVQIRHAQAGWDLAIDPLEEVEERIVGAVRDLVAEVGEAKEGVEHAIDFCAAKGLALAVASSSPMIVIEAALDRLGIRDRFAVVYSAESEPVGKPDPGVYLSTARKLGVSPASCVALEDSPAGIEAAKAARMRCIVVPDRSVVGDSRLDRADLVLGNLAELDDRVWSWL
jgi:sugar-phosphatase